MDFTSNSPSGSGGDTKWDPSLDPEFAAPDPQLAATIFEYAKTGNLEAIKSSFQSIKSDSIRRQLSSHKSAKTSVSKSTPLVIACRNGHLDIVKFLIVECHANIEERGNIEFDKETIDDAPPLWSCAAAGHLTIVQFLIEEALANVNATTKTNSTALRAASYDGHLVVVRYLIEHGADVEIANRYGHTCLMIASYRGKVDVVEYLLAENANVNKVSTKGNTVLHDCAENGSVEIMKMLLNAGARHRVDSFGASPLYAAATAAHEPLVEFLLSLSEDVHQEIDAIRLLASSMIDKKNDISKAITLWTRALTLLQQHAHVYTRRPLIRPVSAYDNATEVLTLSELAEIAIDTEKLKFQALLVREIILGWRHPDTSYYIRYRGATYADMGNFRQCIDLWLHALEHQHRNLDALHYMTSSSLTSFAELFSHMVNHGMQILFRDVFLVFVNCVSEITAGTQLIMNTDMKALDSGGAPLIERHRNDFHKILILLLHFLKTLLHVQDTASPARRKILFQYYNFRKITYRLVKLNPPTKDDMTLLHLACSDVTLKNFTLKKFPSADVVQLLLELGCDETPIDNNGNTPFHHLALSLNNQLSAINTANVEGRVSARRCRDEHAKVTQILLKHGSHVDFRNDDGKNPWEMFPPDFRFGIPFNLHRSLKCLAASAVATSVPTEKIKSYMYRLCPDDERFMLLHSKCLPLMTSGSPTAATRHLLGHILIAKRLR